MDADTTPGLYALSADCCSFCDFDNSCIAERLKLYMEGLADPGWDEMEKGLKLPCHFEKLKKYASEGLHWWEKGPCVALASNGMGKPRRYLVGRFRLAVISES